MAQSVTKSNFKQEVFEAPETVLVDFFAPWCGPCQALLPIIEKVSANPPAGTKIVKVNIDQEPELAGHFEVMSIPTLMVFKNGQVKDVLVGGGLRERDILELLQ